MKATLSITIEQKLLDQLRTVYNTSKEYQPYHISFSQYVEGLLRSAMKE